jgi:hypothetical protein
MKALLKDFTETMLKSLAKDSKMKDYKLSIDDSDRECLMLIWENPSESEKWRKSGYAEYLDNFENVQPMCVLAIVYYQNSPCAYLLTPEEKYYREVVADFDNHEYEFMQMRVNIETYKEFKEALLDSIWKM